MKFSSFVTLENKSDQPCRDSSLVRVLFESNSNNNNKKLYS